MGKVVEFADYTDTTSGPVAPLERAPTREEMTALLEGVAAAAHTGPGALKPLAQLVRVLGRCPWIEGELRMELEGDDSTTTVHLFTEQGGVRERALPPVVLEVPVDELDLAMHATPALFAPLQMRHHKDKLVFTSSDFVATLPPPATRVGDESVPHERPTVKRPPFVMPLAYRSGTHRRRETPEDD